jgi:hypothetical protein
MQSRDIITTTALVAKQGDNLATAGILADFGRFLRLRRADSDASPAMIQSDYDNAAEFVAWGRVPPLPGFRMLLDVHLCLLESSCGWP